MKFNMSRNGYEPKEVNEYINHIRMEYDESLLAQRERIFALQREVDEAERKIKSFDAERRRINEAIESALSKADEMQMLTRRKYAKELYNLRSFHKIWVEHFAKILEKYPLDSLLEATDNVDRAMMIVLDEAEKSVPTSVKSENFDPVGMIEKHLAFETVEDEELFDYNEAIHPKEDLQDILKELGIILSEEKN